MDYKNWLLQFNRKVEVAGRIIELVEYEKPITKGFKGNKIGRSNNLNTTEETKIENRRKIAQRAKKYVRGVANANPELNKFLTLTFAENITDLATARYTFDKFIKRLKTRYENIKYICVPEFQKRGAVHFHLLCNLPYVEVNELAKIWKQGFIKLNKIDNVDNVGAYITKYMTKENIDNRLIGRKCYTMSKGLKKPCQYIDNEIIEDIRSYIFNNVQDVKRTYIKEYESEHYGKIKYMQIIMKTEMPKFKKKRKPLVRLKKRKRLQPQQMQISFN